MNGRRSSSKRKKSNEEEEEDMISKLPEALLHHILSSLEIKEAVRTSILSKRWEYVWTSIPNLIFKIPHEVEEEEEERENVKSKTRFMNFVDRALFLRDSSLKQFSLDCYNITTDIDLRRVRGWMNAIVRRNVEDFKLSFSCRENLMEAFQFPSRFFTAAVWLSRLSIHGLWSLQFPPSICLPNLKHLSLSYVIFPDAESIQNFISGCPVLETMSLLECNWRHVKTVCICGPKLCKLEISEDLDFPEDVDSDAIRSYSCDVIISGPSLKYFRFEGPFLNQYCLYDLPSLDEGEIDVQYSEWSVFDVELCRTRLYKLLKSLSHVKKLCLSSEAMQGLNCLRNVPSFNNLVSFISKGGRLDCEGLAKMLQSSPSLETLVFECGACLYYHCKMATPPTFLSQLKRIETKFDYVYLNQKRLVDGVEILLKATPILEKLIVYLPKGSDYGYGYGYDYDSDCYGYDSDEVADASVDVDSDYDKEIDANLIDKETLIRKVRKLPRASGVCRIEFIFVFI